MTLRGKKEGGGGGGGQKVNVTMTLISNQGLPPIPNKVNDLPLSLCHKDQSLDTLYKYKSLSSRRIVNLAKGVLSQRDPSPFVNIELHPPFSEPPDTTTLLVA